MKKIISTLTFLLIVCFFGFKILANDSYSPLDNYVNATIEADSLNMVAQNNAIHFIDSLNHIVKDTVINKVSYSLYEGAKGGRYILRTSAKTGKTYKQYFKH